MTIAHTPKFRAPSILSRTGLAACAVLAALGGAPAPAVSAAPGEAPAGGLPRLEGLWNSNLKANPGSFSARSRAVVDVNGAPPPLTLWAKAILEARLKAADDDHEVFESNVVKCLPWGLPNMLYAGGAGPVQIIEQPAQVTIISTEGELLLVHMRPQHKKISDPTFRGDSIGHWEGDTLVIDTIGIGGDKTTVDQVGTPHSDDLHLVTRLRRLGPNELEVHDVLEDPKAFTHPWERRITFTRAAPGAELLEDVCENSGPDYAPAPAHR